MKRTHVTKHHCNTLKLVAACAALSSTAVTLDVFADTQIFTSGAHFYKRVVTDSISRTTASETFMPLPNAATTIFIQPNQEVLVNASFDAESRCSEAGGPGTGLVWCELRIMIGGVEGSPQASLSPDTFAFDSTNDGADGIGSWESHAMSRHRCIRNPTGTVMAVPVSVDWKITNNGGVGTPDFWIDDSSLVVELARGCTVQDVPGVLDASLNSNATSQSTDQ